MKKETRVLEYLRYEGRKWLYLAGSSGAAKEGRGDEESSGGMDER